MGLNVKLQSKFAWKVQLNIFGFGSNSFLGGFLGIVASFVMQLFDRVLVPVASIVTGYSFSVKVGDFLLEYWLIERKAHTKDL